ncbi:MAG: hypothetical protein CSA05_00165 [Bacteroidia bacterium]|nr:MAG: hypothetical protein CSA05_00165 [Bacteroidia bacterium]
MFRSDTKNKKRIAPNLKYAQMNKIIRLTLLCSYSFSLFSQNEVVQINTIFFHKDVAYLNTEYLNLNKYYE